LPAQGRAAKRARLARGSAIDDRPVRKHVEKACLGSNGYAGQAAVPVPEQNP
jgi:hypothetical protein